MRTAAVALVLLLAGCASSPPEQPPTAAHVVNLHAYAGKLRYVESSSPAGAKLLFDTGGGLTLYSPAVASAADCTPYKRLTALRMNGERFEVEGCGPSRLTFDALALQPEAGVFDLMALLPKELPRLDGLVSLQTFADHVVTIDLANNSLEIEDRVDARRVSAMRSVAIRFSREFAGAGLDAFVRVQGARGPLWFELDSGNLDDVLISRHAVEQLNVDASRLRTLQEGKPAEISLQIDGLGPVTVQARGADIIYDGALNAALLERMVLVVDLKRALAWAKLNDR
jgi:hypothetical protein